VRAECVPYTLLPHPTKLFSDLLYDYPKVQQFYPRPPDLKQWVREEAKTIKYDTNRRQRVAQILKRQNADLDATAETLNNIERLRAGAACVVTGQQVGLFGGPLFAIFKGLSAIQLAAGATAEAVDCVPVFWLATEDHDLAEVNHANLLSPDGELHTVATSSHGVPDAPVGTVVFGEEISQLIESATKVLGESQARDFLHEAYRPGETLGTAFARLFAKLLGRWGVIMLDASDPELHALVEPIYRAAVERAAELDEALVERGRALTAAGYHEQVKITESSTLVFAIQDGARVAIHRSNGGNGGEFRIGHEHVGRQELLRRISAEPQHFSANVLLRPVVQDYLLPTLAYTGGPAESAYFAQAAIVYQALLGRITPVVPRFSATLVEPRIATLLDKYQLKLSDVFQGPEQLRELLASRILPSDLRAAFDKAVRQLEKSLSEIESSLAKLDPTLVDAAQRAASKMGHQLTHLREKAARAEAMRSDVLRRHAVQLSNALYPHKNLQEREIAGVSFLARHGLELIESLYQLAAAGCPDHQVV